MGSQFAIVSKISQSEAVHDCTRWTQDSQGAEAPGSQQQLHYKANTWFCQPSQRSLGFLELKEKGDLQQQFRVLDINVIFF